jgi:hypothetical protein
MPTRRAILALTIFCFTSRAAWTQSPVAGDWQGSMKVDGTKLHLVLHLREAPDGTLSALIDSLDQDATSIPAEKVTFTRATLRLDIGQVSGTYDGVLSKDGKELKGVWHEGKDRDLIFKRVSDSAKLVPAVPIDGDWEGVFDKEGVQNDVHLHIDTTSCTTIVGQLDTPGAGGNGIQVLKVTFQNGILAFSVKSLRLSYSGMLKDDDSIFEGFWKQGQSYPLTFRRALHPFRVYVRPQGCRG